MPWAHPPQPPEVPPAPSNGGGLIGGGVLLLTFGTLTTSALAACKSSRGEWSSGCLGGVLGAGGSMLAVGSALLAVGIVHRNQHVRWRRQHAPPPRPRLVLAPTAGGGLVLLGGAF